MVSGVNFSVSIFHTYNFLWFALLQQRETEIEKYETRRRVQQAPPAPPKGSQMDYNTSQEQARADDKRSYQDYMVGCN